MANLANFATHIPDNTLTAEDYKKMIAECAYYIAEKRGFAPNHELGDWYQAEQVINKQNYYKFLT